MNPLLGLSAVLGVYMVLGYCYALYLKDNSVADIIYGKAVMLLALVSYFVWGGVGPGCVLTILTIIWGARLSMRIFLKHRGKPEDMRYAQWREQWTQRSHSYFLVRSFVQVFVVQGIVIFIVSLPVVLVNIYGVSGYEWAMYAGVALWVVGFCFESISDYQLDTYVSQPEHKGTICTVGLWKYSRHPNYFGESLMWWGMAFAAIPVLPSGVLAASVCLSPVLITYLLLKVSGIPMLEAFMQKKPGWAEYAARTNAFIPWFPKQ